MGIFDFLKNNNKKPLAKQKINKEPLVIIKDGIKVKETKFYPDDTIESINDGKTCKNFNKAGVLEREYWREDGESSFIWNGSKISSIHYYENGIVKQTSTASPTGIFKFKNFETNTKVVQKFDKNGLRLSISFDDYTFNVDKNNIIQKDHEKFFEKQKKEFSDKLVIIKSEYLSYFNNDTEEDNPLKEIEYNLRGQEYDGDDWYSYDENFGDTLLRYYVDTKNNDIGKDFSNIYMGNAEQEDTYEVEELENLLKEDIRYYGDDRGLDMDKVINVKEILESVSGYLSDFNQSNSEEEGEEKESEIYKFLKKLKTTKP